MKYKNLNYIFLLLISSLLVLSLGTYKAKSEDTNAVLQQIEILQNDIKTLEKAVYSDKVDTNNINTELSGEGGDVLTKHLLKLSELEEQFKNLTNNFEEINFKLDKLSNRITKIQTDNQMRFQDIEQSETLTKNNKSKKKKKLPGSSEPQDLGSVSVEVVPADEVQKTQSIESVGSVISEEAERAEKERIERELDLSNTSSSGKNYRIASTALEMGDTLRSLNAQYAIADALPEGNPERRRALAGPHRR